MARKSIDFAVLDRLNGVHPNNNTGCPRPEFTERNGYSSEIKHFRPYIGKAQMCFRSEQFVYTYQLFVYKKDKIAENVTIFQSCFLGLVVRVRAAILKVPRSNPIQDS